MKAIFYHPPALKCLLSLATWAPFPCWPSSHTHHSRAMGKDEDKDLQPPWWHRIFFIFFIWLISCIRPLHSPSFYLFGRCLYCCICVFFPSLSRKVLLCNHVVSELHFILFGFSQFISLLFMPSNKNLANSKSSYWASTSFVLHFICWTLYINDPSLASFEACFQD